MQTILRVSFHNLSMSFTKVSSYIALSAYVEDFTLLAFQAFHKGVSLK